MLKIQIKHRFTDEVLFEFEATDEQQESGLALRHALEAATTSGAYLRGADLGGDLKLAGKRPALQIGPLGSRADTLLAFVTDQGLRIRAGCFFGTRDEFVAAVAKVHGDNVHAREYASALVMIDAHAAAWPADEAPAELPAPAEAS